MNSRNLGRFSIDAGKIKANPNKIADMFAILQIVPVRAEYLFESDEIEYTAIGVRFKEIPKAMRVPRYKLKVTKTEAGNIESIEVIEET